MHAPCSFCVVLVLDDQVVCSSLERLSPDLGFPQCLPVVLSGGFTGCSWTFSGPLRVWIFETTTLLIFKQ